MDSEGPDQTAHLCSLIRVFTFACALKAHFRLASSFNEYTHKICFLGKVCQLSALLTLCMLVILHAFLSAVDFFLN